MIWIAFEPVHDFSHCAAMDFLEQLGEFACNDDPACRLENIGQCIQGFFNPVWRFIENKGRTGVSQGFQVVFTLRIFCR